MLTYITSRFIYACRQAMPKTGSAIAVATTPAAILPTLYKTAGTVMNTHPSIANVIVMATMTEMIAMAEEIEMGVMTGMITVMAVAMVNTRAATVKAKEEIN